MTKAIIFLSLFFFSVSIYAQGILIETIVFTNTIDTTNKSKIPFAVDKDGKNGLVVQKINEAIKNQFMLEGFDPKQANDFRYSNVEFNWEIKSNCLLISYTGEAYGAYISTLDNRMFFDLTTGNLLREELLPYQALFSLEGFYKFLNKYWIKGCNSKFKIAENCAGAAAAGTCYDIQISEAKNKSIAFTLESGWFAHVAQACNASYQVIVPLDSLMPFLSDFGSYVLFQTSYLSSTHLEKFIFCKENSNEIPSYYFIVGKIADKYPFSMAIELVKKSNNAKGYYFYHQQQKPIKLEGSYDSLVVKVQESVDNKVTGRFEFSWQDKYSDNGFSVTDDLYLTANWFDSKDKMLLISLQVLKMNKTCCQ